MCRLKALLRILLQTGSHDVFEGSWSERLERADRIGVFFQNGGCQRNLTLTFKGSLSCRHLVKHCAKGKDVGAGVCFLSFDLLRRHVLNGADDAARCG